MPDCTIKEWSLEKVARLVEVEELKLNSECKDFVDVARWREWPFVKATIGAKKWGFVIDVVRWLVLYHEGGVFLDADVELVKPLPEGCWLSAEKDEPLVVNPGQGVSFPAAHPFVMAALKEYEQMAFNPNKMVVCASPHVITRMLGREDVPRILPSAMMNPLGWSGGRLGELPSECCAIHWYAASWFNWKQRLVYKTFPRMGIDVGRIIRWFRR